MSLPPQVIRGKRLVHNVFLRIPEEINETLCTRLEKSSNLFANIFEEKCQYHRGTQGIDRGPHHGLPTHFSMARSLLYFFKPLVEGFSQADTRTDDTAQRWLAVLLAGLKQCTGQPLK